MTFLRPLILGLRQSSVWALKKLVRGYQIALSPLFPPSCRYSPSCSAYALEALETHGPLKGGLLTLRRLGRCHPIEKLGGGSGYDPVPPCGCKPDAEALPSSTPFTKV